MLDNRVGCVPRYSRANHRRLVYRAKQGCEPNSERMNHRLRYYWEMKRERNGKEEKISAERRRRAQVTPRFLPLLPPAGRCIVVLDVEVQSSIASRQNNNSH